MRDLSWHGDLWRVFADFAEAASLALEQVPFFDAAREARYMAIAERRGPDAMRKFAEAYALTVEALDDRPHDFLGQAFMSLELSNHWIGQFFTPPDLCDLMARMMFGNREEMLERIEMRGFITIEEPACGAGAMLIAALHSMREQGVNFQRHAWFCGTDLHEPAARAISVWKDIGEMARSFQRSVFIAMEKAAAKVKPNISSDKAIWQSEDHDGGGQRSKRIRNSARRPGGKAAKRKAARAARKAGKP